MIRIGVDFGGTKIEAAALDAEGRFQARVRVPSPGSYEASLEAVRELIAEAERQAGTRNASIGAYAFSDVYATPVRQALHGDSSGVRGAAWLWPLE